MKKSWIVGPILLVMPLFAQADEAPSAASEPIAASAPENKTETKADKSFSFGEVFEFLFPGGGEDSGEPKSMESDAAAPLARQVAYPAVAPQVASA